MARNKYPEQTLDLILAVSTQMFTEKGYEKTSIQDIIDALGMSKGAIYHHFKSKEDILSAVMEKELGRAEDMFMELIQNTHAPNARQKLISILENIIVDPGIQSNSIDQVLSTQIKNPQFVLGGIRKGVLKDARIIANIMEQGKSDGSISVEYPLECAEIFMLLVNIWINPLLFGRDQAQTLERLKFLQHMMKLLGADIVSEQLIQRITNRHASTGGYAEAE
ncbi:TetR/AcrR family transcriptional regulator [Paenibacillus sp. SZ31]|uniref:TetR/AcrR family transcriptional regulator n=1 Tax=Paenibacillus sp. SZ31 TaxID=2725555 RepID=UPI00146B93C6|nr:TetR/AcrR family transcriptional regulator [Paenibacillus sp. SZ31]NMI06361.1 TetR/AcrR family transcriptional regulator [Paenibacillus sp. SZ31]